MLTAYLDESSDERVYTVAGLVTKNDNWTSFSAQWELALKTDPKISHFKMHDVFTTRNNGVFKNYTIQQRTDKTEALIEILNTHLAHRDDLAGSIVMDIRAYKSMLDPVLARRYRSPYLWCFQGILVSYSSWIKEMMPVEKVNFIFDDNKKEFRDALKLYERVAHLPGFSEFKNFVGGIKPGDDRTVMPLQAADLLAGQTRLYGTNRASATFLPSITRSGRSHFSYLLGKNRLMAMRTQIQATTAWVQEFMRH
ncbi:MAG: DUF3800 domain-containing protein [Bryobacteraceae bacterium]|jgi:hypothetical protein